jgi:hypothetical protein
VRAIIDKKMAAFDHVAGDVRILHMDLDAYFEAAAEDPDIRFAIETGFMSEVESELRDPVLVDEYARVVRTCPPLAMRVLTDEPPEIHRPFVEGAFIRKFFRFFVPATHEGGAPWEASQQVREIMQRHFALQLVVTETLLGQAS